VQEEFTFPKLRFRRSHQDRQGAMEGRAAHFIIPGLGVLQRIGGKAKSSVAKLIYAFRHRPRLKALLDFADVAIKVFSEQFENEFRNACKRKKSE
jgi:hypothetical protein